MDRVSIIKAIVGADKKARAYPADAKATLDRLDQALSEERRILRDEYFRRAERRIEAVRDAENTFADDSIAALRGRFETDAKASVAAAAARREQWAEDLFRAVIDAPTGE